MNSSGKLENLFGRLGEIRTIGKSLGLSHTQSEVLAYVSYSGNVSSGEVRSALRFSARTASLTLGFLCDEGYVKSIGEGRAIIYRLSSKGQRRFYSPISRSATFR